MTKRPKSWHSRGYLPYFDSAATVQFVTFRLADSLPRDVIAALRPKPDAVLLIDQKLDAGLGACWLRDAEIAALVQDALMHFDGERYRLLAWCVMPNHVHVVAEMLEGHALSDGLRAGSPLQGAKPTPASVAPGLLGDRLLRPLHAQ